MGKRFKRGTVAGKVLTGYFVAFVVFLYGPLFCMFVLSFQTRRGITSLPRGFLKYYYYKFIGLFWADVTEQLSSRAIQGIRWGLHWWEVVFDPARSEDLHAALLRSIILALVMMGLTAFFSTTLAMAFRQKFRGSGVLFYAVMAGLMVPGLLVSLGTMLLFKALGWSSAWYFSGLGVQFIWTLPFGFLIMIAVFNQFPTDLEEVARDLGANKWSTFMRVTLPIIAPGILGAGLFGFTFSYDEFARTIFVSGANNTLPLHIYAKMTVEIEPILYTLGTASTVFS
ncbi:MAG: ABC transporter permease subunit, partial [Desulfobacteraceae bacterium]|nr:ABC transporter permease subunit [Desulfobacteraceae bacterium]